MKNTRIGKVLPAFDLLLLLTLSMYSLMGFRNLTQASKSTNGFQAVLNLTQEQMKCQLGELEAENERMRADLGTKEAEAEDLAHRRLNVKEAGPSTKFVGVSEASLKATREKVETLRVEIMGQEEILKDLEQKRERFNKERALPKKVSEDRATRLNELRQIEDQNRALGEEIASLGREQLIGSRPTIQVERTPLITVRMNRSPVYVALVSSMVTPIGEPYYTLREKVVERGGGRFETMIEATMKNRGESIDRALSKGSCFYEMLKDIHSKDQYVALFVDSQSFETFRAVRRMLRQRGIPFGWEPCLSPTVHLSAAGQTVGEEMD